MLCFALLTYTTYRMSVFVIIPAVSAELSLFRKTLFCLFSMIKRSVSQWLSCTSENYPLSSPLVSS